MYQIVSISSERALLPLGLLNQPLNQLLQVGRLPLLMLLVQMLLLEKLMD